MPMNIVIQEQRKLLGLTQEQVADYLGVSTPAVSKWEKGIVIMYQHFFHWISREIS